VIKGNHMFARLLKAISFALILFFVSNALKTDTRAQSVIGDVRPGEVLVEIRPGASIDAINERYGTSTIQRIYGTNVYRLVTPRRKKEAKFRKRLANDPDMINASLNPIIATPINVFGRAVIGFPGDHPTTGQARANYLEQQLVGDLASIQLRSKGAGVIVAVIDTGIDRGHPDIKDHLWTDPGEIPNDNLDNDNDGLVDDVFGWNFLDSNRDTMELRSSSQSSIAGHGTFIAGLIALIAPNAKIMPIRAFSADGVGDAFSVAQGIKYAVDHGAQVINLSFGSTEDSPVLHDAISYANQRGVFLIAAVGNENKPNDSAPQFPANWSAEVMSVAAVDGNNRKAGFSNFGSNVSVSAPGLNLISLFPEANNTPDYAVWSGTSFATPLATAEAALLLEDNPRRSARDIIESTAINIDNNNPGFTGKLGRGRIDALRALQSLDSVTTNRSEITLLPTAIEPQSQGKAEVSVIGGEQKFEIETGQLQPRAAYKIVVDGNVIIDGTSAADPNRARAITTNFGALKIEFRSPASGNNLPLPASLIPVTSIKLVEVRDALNRVVLSNTFVARPGGGSQIVEKEATLNPTGVIPQANGKARAEVESEREKLRVEADYLESGASYSIIADGLTIASAIAQSGYLRVEFTSDGSSGIVLPPSLRPVTIIQSIELRNSIGQAVVRGTFQAGGDDFGGGGHGGGESSFQGAIETLPAGGFIGDWRVGGRTVHVTASTEIRQDHGAAVIGALVEVRGATQSDGSTNATRIEVLSQGSGGGGGGAQREATLNPSGIDPDATGRVKIDFSSSREEVEIEASKLEEDSSYTVVVDGFLLPTIATDGSGSFKIRLSTDDGSLPSQLRPVTNIQQVRISDSQGRLVLSGGPPM
jgi:subtilisin family serine protease